MQPVTICYMNESARKGTVAIQSILGANSEHIAEIRQRIAVIQAIQDKLKATLPSPLSDHFIIANISRDTLILHTHSPAWAAKLRFNTPEILRCVKEHFDALAPKSLRIKVVPESPQPALPIRKIRLTEKNAQLIKQTAESITDPKLREAMVRLSRKKNLK